MTRQRSDALSRRRVFVKSACATALAGLAGCPRDGSEEPSTDPPPSPDVTATTPRSPTASEPARDYGDRFETVVDIVDAGADPGGERPVNDVVREHAGDDTLLVFPSGTYLLEPLHLSMPTNVGFVAAEGADPALLPTNVGSDAEWLYLSEADSFVLDGLDFEYSDVEAMGGTTIQGPGPVLIRDLRVRGAYRPIAEQLMRIDVTDENGEAVVENLVARGVDQQGVNATGIYVGRHHAGDITFRNCRLDQFSDNALYASPPGGEGGQFDAAGGTVHVEGGEFRNNNIAAIRIGSTGSTVRDATIVVDRTPPHIDEDSLNARGIRLRGQRGQLVENCRLVYGPDAGYTSGAITIHDANGHARIRNVDIEMNRDGVNAIFANPPRIDGDVSPTLENVTISGTAGREQAISIVGRPETSVQNCCIRQSGANRDGIVFVDSAGCSVDRSQIDVPGEPVVLRNSSLDSTYTPAEVCPEQE